MFVWHTLLQNFKYRLCAWKVLISPRQHSIFRAFFPSVCWYKMNQHRTIVCYYNNNDYRQQFAWRWLYINGKLLFLGLLIKIRISKWNGFAQWWTLTTKHFSIMIYILFLFFHSFATKDETSNIWQRNQNTVFWIQYI